MRLLCELVIVAAILYLGWETPLGQHVPWLKPAGSASQAARTRQSGRQFATTNGAKPSAVPTDRPAYNKDRSFTGHIIYVDDAGKKYWLDAQGQRHYQQ